MAGVSKNLRATTTRAAQVDDQVVSLLGAVLALSSRRDPRVTFRGVAMVRSPRGESLVALPRFGGHLI